MTFGYFNSTQDWLIVALIAVPNMIIPLWALIDCAIRPNTEGSNKALWILAIIFGGFIGSVLYFFLGRKPSPAA